MGRRLEVVEVYRCMDCGGLINYENDECSCKTSTKNQRKKGEKVASRIAHLETQSVQEEDNTQVKCKTKDVDNLVDTDALTNPSLDEVSRIDGRRLKSNKKDVEDSKGE